MAKMDVDMANYGANMVIKKIFKNATLTYKLIKNKSKKKN